MGEVLMALTVLAFGLVLRRVHRWEMSRAVRAERIRRRLRGG